MRWFIVSFCLRVRSMLLWAEALANELDPISSGRVLSLARYDIDEDEPPTEKPLYGRPYY